MEKILQDFITNTPDLLNFFAGYFPLAEFEGTTDKQVVENYIDSNTQETIQQTKIELEALSNHEETLQFIARETNKYFESQDEIWKWIQTIKSMYLKKLEQV